jgi:hypothetical protein
VGAQVGTVPASIGLLVAAPSRVGARWLGAYLCRRKVIASTSLVFRSSIYRLLPTASMSELYYKGKRLDD